MEQEQPKDGGMLLELAISLALHLAVLAFLFFGLPSFVKKRPEEQIVAIEMINVSDTTNVKTQKLRKDKVKTEEVEDAKKVQQSKDVIKELAEAKPKIEPETKPDKPELQEEVEHKPEPKSEPKSDVVKIPEKPQEQKKQPDTKKIDNKKPKPKTVTSAKQKEKKAKDTDLDSLLKTLEKESDGKEEKSKKQSVVDDAFAEYESKGGEFNEDTPLSITEAQSIKQQIERQWNIPAGAQNVWEITITLYIALKPDGSVEKVELVDKKCGSASSVLCEALADSAMRAVWLVGQFNNLAEERYKAWRESNIAFNPGDIAK